MTKYNLVGIDGNAFSVMGYVAMAMKEVGMDKDEISEYRNDAMSSDYNHLLSVSIDMVQLCNEQWNKKNGIYDDDEYDYDDF